MDYKKVIKISSDVILKNFRYSVKIIFANKFIYFSLAAVIYFLLVTVIKLFSTNSADTADVYNLLLLPGILLIFYPTTFGIQNDEDSGMLENLFAIPNYRFKVWLPRIFMVYILEFILLIILSLLSSFSLTVVPVFDLTFQLMFPIFFLGSLAFALSTVIKNGSGTAVVMVIIGLTFWISSGILKGSEWNIFLNPYRLPDNMSETIWNTVITNNRLYLFVGSLLAILYALFNLQHREKFFK